MIFAEVTNYLQTPPGSVFYFSSYWWSQAYNTHIRAYDKPLFLHKTPSVKPTPHSPPLFHQEDATEKYHFSNFNGSI